MLTLLFWRLTRRGVQAATVVVAFLVLQTSAEASAMLYLEPAELADRAELVIEGEVTSQVVRMQGGYPVTVSTLQVMRCAQKACPQEVSVTQLGGEVGDIGLQVSGVKHLTTGSKVVVFLRARAGQWQTVARNQGVFQVVSKGEEDLFVRDLEGLGLVLPTPQHTPLRVLPRHSFRSVFGLVWQAVPAQQ